MRKLTIALIACLFAIGVYGNSRIKEKVLLPTVFGPREYTVTKGLYSSPDNQAIQAYYRGEIKMLPLMIGSAKLYWNDYGQPYYATYFVSTTGNSGNPGTEGSPWNLAHAFSTAVAGDIVRVKAGNYGALQINTSNAGTSGNTIQFIGYTTTPGDIVATSGPTYTYAQWLANSNDLPDNVMPHLELNPAGEVPGSTDDAFDITHQYIEIHNFMVSEYMIGWDVAASNTTLNNVIGDQFGNWDPGAIGWDETSDGFDHTNRNGYGINYQNGMDNGIITNNLVIDAGFVTYFIRGDNNTITDNVAVAQRTGNGADYMFDIYGSNNNVIDGCTARRNYDNLAGHNSRALAFQSGSTGNMVTDFTSINGRVQFEHADNNTIIGLTMTVANGGNGENSISIQIACQSDDNLIKNFSMIGGGGVQVLAYESGDCDGSPTVVTAGEDNYLINGKIADLNTGSGNGVFSFNRLGTGAGIPGGNTYMVNITAYDFHYLINANNTDGGTVHWYNASISAGTHTQIDTFYPGWPDGTSDYTANFTSVNDFNNAFPAITGTDISTGDPLLDASLIPQAGSALIDSGMDASTLNANADTDFLGNARGFNGVDDIGAYEFGSSPPGGGGEDPGTPVTGKGGDIIIMN